MEKQNTAPKTPEELEKGFMNEVRPDGSLRWERLIPGGLTDQFGNEWRVYCDERQKESVRHGWQVHWYPKGGDGYRWALIKSVARSAVPGYFEIYYIDISQDGDEKIILTIFINKCPTAERPAVILCDELGQVLSETSDEVIAEVEKSLLSYMVRHFGKTALQDLSLAA